MEQIMLFVKTLGGFSLICDGHTLQLERGATTKSIQLLQLLLHAGDQGVPRETLLRSLYHEGQAQPANNLKVTAFRLRKLLTALPLPEGDPIRIQKRTYYWNSALIPVREDARAFEEAARLGMETHEPPELRIARLQDALRLYDGEFLPQLFAEEWVAMESARYRRMYLNCLDALYALCRETGRWEDVLPYCGRASAIYPFNESLHVMCIRCHLALGNYSEALAAYERAAGRYMDELGLPPSPALEACFQRLKEEARKGVVGELQSIKKELLERQELPGAYYCVYPMFMECYRIVTRMMERSGLPLCLMLCSFQDGADQPAEPGTLLFQAAQHLETAIEKTLRRGDMYTRYSPSQYLILLSGTDTEICVPVSRRLNEIYLKECGGKAALHVCYQCVTAIEVEQNGPQLRFSPGGALWE